MRFSIVVPTYNTEKLLGDCVGSVLAQTYTDWELLLVDDGSTDGSGTLADSFAKLDGRIHAYHQENTGQFFARRAGIDRAVGDYVLFLDSDDTFTDDCLEKVEAALRRQAADIVMFAGKIIKDGQESGGYIGRISEEACSAQTDWLKEKLIASHELNSLCLKAYRRALFEDDHHDYAAFRGVHCGEDKAQLLYPVTRAGSIIYIPDCLYQYYHRENSIMHGFAIDTIQRMMANEMYSLLYQYMQKWAMDGPEYQELAAVYYLRNYLSVYFGLRKRCTTLRERWEFRHYPWRTSVNREAFHYCFSDKLTVKEKFKLLVARLHI
ncbi:glycosyltransferase family 2 protein [Vescimonas sp.]|uniref:glycosyltransferase family 2 protein n=1 Tax=Vescimonas sp. TaxID=2892404 RepID=UPI003F7EA721